MFFGRSTWGLFQDGWRDSMRIAVRAAGHNLGEGGVVVDALLVDGAGFEPGDAFILFQEASGVSDDVLDENGVVEGLHRHVAFVGALEQWVNGRRSGPLSYINQFLDPDELPEAVLALRPDGQGYEAPLVVRTIVADLLRARAERRARHADAARG